MVGWEIREGDALERLREMSDESVQCCVTSPPYFGLRDYGIEGQIGLEATPDEFVARLVGVFGEVRRVLRSDGTLWLNMGDSYAGTWGNQGRKAERGTQRPINGEMLTPVLDGRYPSQASGTGTIPKGADYKAKDLLGIPWLLAFALRADGWWLRSDIIWAKPNPMPESVTDRPTSAHEHVFLLSKSPRYFYDADAIREPHLTADDGRNRPDYHVKRGRAVPMPDCDTLRLGTVGAATWPEAGRNKRNVWEIATQPYPDAHFACVDEATDCLTAEGWKRHDELHSGMLAAQFDMKSQTLSWAPIQDVARYDVTDQEMVVGQRRDMSMVLTPNHRCVIQRRHPRTRQHQAPTIVRADGLLPSHTIPTAAPWASSDGDTSLPREWAELLGWYIAEGYESQQALAVELYQSEDANPTKVARIESLLRQVGAEWTVARARGQVAFRVIGYAALRLRELAPAKRIPPSALLWSQDRIAALLDGLIDGDGHRRPDGRMSFVQKDTQRAGMVQALALRLGLSAHLTKRPDGINTVYLTKHRTRSFRGTAGQGAPLGLVRYSGIVWCPRLPAGTWVARRDGKPFITGNTFPPKLVEPCILAGSSPKACGECGAPWERVVERTSVRTLAARQGYAPIEGSRARAGIPNKLSMSNNHGDIAQSPEIRTLGWQPSCAHQDDTGRSVILDPFAGAGTTGLVALRHGRSFIGIELSPAYAEMARERIRDDAPLFNVPAERTQLV